MSASNINKTDNTVEEIFRNHIRAMSGKERLAKAFCIWNELILMLELQVKRKNPSLEGEALKFAVAERVYAARPETLVLLRKAKQ